MSYNIIWLLIIIFNVGFARRKIYTYHDGSFNQSQYNLRSFLLKLWMRNWYKYGYDPVILNISHAQKHNRYHELKKYFEKLPTVNDPNYELCCYLRWLAFSSVGGGIMMDYDIYGFSKNDPLNISVDEEGFISFSDFMPMISFANNSSSVENFINFLATYNITKHDNFFGKPHVSDMQMVLRDPKKVISKIIYQTPLVVHFSYKLLSIYSVSMKEKLSRRIWPNQLIVENIKHQEGRIFILVPKYENLNNFKTFKIIYKTLKCESRYQKIPNDLKNIVYSQKKCNVKLLYKMSSLIEENVDFNNDFILIMVMDPIEYFLEWKQQDKERSFMQNNLLWNFFDKNTTLLHQLIYENISNERILIGILNKPQETFLRFEYGLGMIFSQTSENLYESFNEGKQQRNCSSKYIYQWKRRNENDMKIFHLLLKKFRVDLDQIFKVELQINPRLTRKKRE